MTTYRLDVPDWLWDAYKDTVTQSETLNDPLEAQIAARVADNHPDSELQDRAEGYLNGTHR
jgi:hypothetical protein